MIEEVAGTTKPLVVQVHGETGIKNQQYFRSLEPLLRALHQADIDCMFLCGSAFALNYHRDYALHAEANLTILIPLEQVWLAFKQLHMMSWQQLRSLPISWREQLEYRLRSSNLLLGYHFWQLWFIYPRYSEGDSLAQSLLGFPRYLQHFLQLPTLGQVPGQAMSILRQHLRRRFSLSRRIV